MRKSRRGFTLVELLIVIAILATLSTSMMISFGGSTASAKAASIVTNVDMCMTAAKIYYAENINSVKATEDADTTTTDAAAIQGKIGNWEKMKTNGTISYTIEGVGTNNWAVKVDFSTAPDATDIEKALKKIPGYDDATQNFSVNLLTGDITAAGSGGGSETPGEETPGETPDGNG